MGKFKPWASVSQATRNSTTSSSSRLTKGAHSPSKTGPMGLANGDLSKSGIGGSSSMTGSSGGVFGRKS